MLILYYYQRLFLFSLFYSGRSEHPLLAIHTSELLSKPNTSPSTLYIILYYMIKLKIDYWKNFIKNYQKLFTFVNFLYKIYRRKNNQKKKLKGAIGNENFNAYMGISTKNSRRNCKSST